MTTHIDDMLAAELRNFAAALGVWLGEGIGFASLTSPPPVPLPCPYRYTSNGNRADVAKLLTEWLVKTEGGPGQQVPPTEPPATAALRERVAAAVGRVHRKGGSALIFAFPLGDPPGDLVWATTLDLVDARALVQVTLALWRSRS